MQFALYMFWLIYRAVHGAIRSFGQTFILNSKLFSGSLQKHNVERRYK